jgi:very-short-patch-repair endonuclease
MVRQKYKTNIERIMAEILDNLGIEAVYDYPIRCKYSYRIDFAIPEKKIGIECDGEFWHPINSDKDRKRDKFLESIGWQIIRFKGNDILKGNINLNKLRSII